MAVNALKYYRDKVGITQAALGKELGLDPALMSKMESGFLVPTPEQLEKLADLLQTTPAHLFSRHILAEVAERARAEAAS
jgi:transcriptional regulator with XRE-family HTH domain